MTFPNFHSKHEETALFSPEDFTSYLKTQGLLSSKPLPEAVILCYDKRLLEYLKTSHPVSVGDGFFSKYFFLDDTGGQLAVVGNFGIGAPAAAVVLEECIALGIKRFLNLGTAGSLQKNILVGDLVVCEKAIRDEGVSHHYLAPEKYAHPSRTMTEKIKASLNGKNLPFHAGTSWTIDAPYRETVTEARHYQEEGVATVEMEASALFAVAAYRGAEIGAVFTISDSLADLTWRPDFHSPKTRQGLESLFRTAKDVLLLTH